MSKKASLACAGERGFLFPDPMGVASSRGLEASAVRNSIEEDQRSRRSGGGSASSRARDSKNAQLAWPFVQPPLHFEPCGQSSRSVARAWASVAPQRRAQ